MTARKAARRPKARKETLVEICGHMLTKEQYDEYSRELADRRGRMTESIGKAQESAVRNVLYRERPSVKARKALDSMELWQRANEAFASLGGLRGAWLCTADMKTVALYNAIIGHLAEEFLAVGKELAAMHAAIAAETRKEEVQP